MSNSNILTLNKPMAPRLVQILYWIALVLIALGVVHGIVGGVRTMTSAEAAMAASPAAAPGAPSDMSAAAPVPNGPQAGTPPRRGPGFGLRYFHGPRFAGRGPHGFMMTRGPMMLSLSPVALGALRILLALIRGAIFLMVVRVLAEIGTAILAMGAKAK